jgi:hypothetical protein
MSFISVIFIHTDNKFVCLHSFKNTIHAFKCSFDSKKTK